MIDLYSNTYADLTRSKKEYAGGSQKPHTDDFFTLLTTAQQREMPPETFDPIAFAFKNIRDVSFYINFEYKPNWVTPFVISDLLLQIVGILIFIQIPIFYLKNKQKIKKIGLRLDIFQAFILMQIWSIFMVIGAFLIFRIPHTGIITNYCANNNPQVLLRFSVFYFLWTFYSSELFILLFCALRVAILYSNSTKEREKIMYYLIPPFIIFPFLTSVPNLLAEGLCQQMPQPFPIGAILIASRFHTDHKTEFAFASFAFTAIGTFTIIGLNFAMFWKICKRKKLSGADQSQSIQNQKVSRTLTGTMIIMLVPLVIHQLGATVQLFPNSYLPIIIFFSSLVSDMRVPIVTCYFYFTHPVFKKHRMMKTTVVSPIVTIN
ncbi:hypothetical protein CRE_06095 [Caenorhabditis remanei]|uniref:Uncharacterized protein n=1 Tax=Caenorhabditis remanei TaxID=31234 RepID=E3NB09_CAERE|nr:hypothetical protein CRE_06095 [Caenorhabditis remanei]